MRLPSLVFVASLLAGCSGSGNGAGTPIEHGSSSFERCVGRGRSPDPEEDFEHTASSLLALTDPVHSAEDLVAPLAEAPVLAARFAYGPLATDLKDEQVRVWLDDCGRWQKLGDFTTDDDARRRLERRGAPG